MTTTYPLRPEQMTKGAEVTPSECEVLCSTKQSDKRYQLRLLASRVRLNGS